jgi:hypothetical protein
MPTFYDYFRTHQKGKSCGVECVENPVGSCPRMVRKLYINSSICSLEKYDDNSCEEQSNKCIDKCDKKYTCCCDDWYGCDNNNYRKPNKCCDDYGEISSVINDELDEQWTIRWSGGVSPELSCYDKEELNYIRDSGVKLLYVLEKKVKILPDVLHLFSAKCFDECVFKNVKIVLTFGRLNKCGKHQIFFSEEGKIDNKRNILTWNICSRKLEKCKANFFSFDIIFPTQGTCDYVPKFEMKFEEFNTDLLREWLPSDYSRGTEYPRATSFTDKAFFYNSRLALEGELFDQGCQHPDYPGPYQESNYNTSFCKPDSGVPGPFPWGMSISQWTGDTQFDFGPHLYTQIYSHWSYSHALTIITKINILLRDKCSPTKSQDKLLDNITNGSIEQFLRISGLVDLSGNPIPYGTPDSTKDQLMGFMDKLITGKGTNCGVIEIEELIDAIQGFKNGFAPNSNDAQTIIDDLASLLNEILRRNVRASPVQFKSWSHWVKTYVCAVQKSFELYRKLYSTDVCSPEYCRLRDQTNAHVAQTLDLANQYAALFTFFYSTIAILDIILDVLGNQTQPAIPSQYRLDRVKLINNAVFRYWKQKMHFFDDYAKAAALCREDDMYRSELSLISSFTISNIIESEVLRALDNWIRLRDGLNSLVPTTTFPSTTFPSTTFPSTTFPTTTVN